MLGTLTDSSKIVRIDSSHGIDNFTPDLCLSGCTEGDPLHPIPRGFNRLGFSGVPVCTFLASPAGVVVPVNGFTSSDINPLTGFDAGRAVMGVSGKILL